MLILFPFELLRGGLVTAHSCAKQHDHWAGVAVVCRDLNCKIISYRLAAWLTIAFEPRALDWPETYT